MADYKQFVQKNGPRQGQKYKIKTGKSGLKIRVYASGDTAIVGRSKQPTAKLGVYDTINKGRKNPKYTNPYAS